MSLSHITGYQLTRANLVSLSSYARHVERVFDLRPVEFTILQMLREGICDTPSQLAKELSMTPPSMSVWLDKLSARQLIARSKSALDGRAQQLQLTQSGADLVAKAHDALMQGEQKLLAHLSEGERVILLEILHKLCEKPHFDEAENAQSAIK
jgi:DNA-binding MarR family transcriptional regulator